ncbi:MAG TPA: DNA-processing protein DprA [Burkholderiaceae bacterium]|nr:DNA-processing protein DprA [Burkholderiaceae bacterium]
MELDELAAWLRLTLSTGIGNGTARKLLAAFGLPQAIFAQPASALRQVVGPAQATALLSEPPGIANLLETTHQWLSTPDATGGHRAIMTIGDARFPGSLLNIEDPPLMLYAMGVCPAFARDGGGDAQDWIGDISRNIAIVGSRNPTPQGEFNAREFAKALSEAGLTVVSGLALGVDGAAHQGALDGASPGANPLATIAVVGTGLDRVYPKRHLELAHRIAQQGLLLSEFPLGTPALAENFPKRNRIISGLSQATLVVEAALRSGSLITARMASEQGRDVFAVPGSIHSPQSCGCHALIKQGAKLVESAQDVLEELKVPAAPGARPQARQADHQPEAGTAQSELLAQLGFDPVSLDALVARTGMDAAQLQVRLLELELSGDVARLPGGLFQRVGTA